MSRFKKIFISAFVIFWTFIFHYESTRHFYLDPLFRKELPKLKFLFPPAGWIMFYNVGEGEGRAEVYGLKRGQTPFLIDPHRIFNIHWLGYDNIRRNILGTVLHPSYSYPFCNYLRRKFPQYPTFSIVQVYYPSVVKEPNKKLYQEAYRCGTPY
ncbi:MAG: hypothetical protein HY400_02455 [Elusimicrobia bacterium]|nr:hypothetical protein [Elusimicrobiota bacterium]